MTKNYISIKNEEKRIITAPVAIPDCPDCDFQRGEKVLTQPEIEDMAHNYMKYRKVDKLHDFFYTNKEVGYPVENWLLREPMTVKNIHNEEIKYPQGTWMASLKVTDDETWALVKAGQLNGNSATYLSKETVEKINAASKGRVLIKDLNEPVPYTISLVPEPCVHDAIFTSIKMRTNAVVDDKSIVEKARDLLNNLLDGDEPMTKDENKSEKSEEYVTKSDFDNFKTEVMNAIKDKKEPEKSEKEEEKKEEPSEKSGPPHKEQDGSKAIKNHDNGEKEVSFKSMEYYMGRTPKGRPIKKEE